MSHLDLFIVKILHTLVFVAMSALLGQGAVGLLSGARRATNPIYVLFQVITKPVVRFTRWLAPKVILDQHIPFVAFDTVSGASFSISRAMIYPHCYPHAMDRF